jgi:hypothetical protein
MRAHRLADLRRELEVTRDPVHRSHLEYELRRELLDQAIEDAEDSREQLVNRLATVDRRAELTSYRLRAVRHYEVTPPPASKRPQRSSTTISVAHATAS